MPLSRTVTPDQLHAADFGQHFSHEKESARPGYYQVLLQESGVNVESEIRIVDSYSIEGYRLITGWAKLRKVYFKIEFSKPIVARILMDGSFNVGNSNVVSPHSLFATWCVITTVTATCPSGTFGDKTTIA